MDRRNFLLLLIAALLGGAEVLRADLARADSGKGDSGDSDSHDGGSDDGGSDDGGDDSDSGNSGSGGDDGKDDAGDDDSKDDDNSGKGKNGTGAEDGDHVKARDAVREGKILPLREILKRVEAMDTGRVISVELSLQGRSPFYTLKVQSEAGRVKTLRVNAVTGRKLSTFGWW